MIKAKHVLPVILTPLIFALTSFAEQPNLSHLLQSKAGKALFETKRGAQCSQILTGTVGIDALLLRHLGSPLNDALVAGFEQRLEHVHRRFLKLYPDSAALWQTGSDLELTAEQKKTLEELAFQEFEQRFLKSIPKDPLTKKELITEKNAKKALAAKTVRGNPEEFLRTLAADPDTAQDERAVTFARVEAIRKTHTEWSAFFEPGVLNSLLAENENHLFVVQLNEIMDLFKKQLSSRSAAAAKLNKMQKLEAAIRKSLKDNVPAASIDGRISSFKKYGDRIVTLRRVLGEMTQFETQILLHGGDVKNPTPESLLGQYLAESHAATVVRTFPKAPGAPEQSEERLVVSVTPQQLDLWKKYFAKPFFMSHNHEPQQGTLYLQYEGNNYSYARNAGEFDFELESILPLMVFSSMEAERIHHYFVPGATGSMHGSVKLPWSLNGGAGKPSYCKIGGYLSCTHWFGDIPFGENFVRSLSFPGNVDVYAQGAADAGPQVGKVSPYVDPQGVPADQIRRIWKVPSNQQLHEAFDLTQAQFDGELANPGYVAYALTGKASVSRVPVVFRVVQDGLAPIDPAFDTMIHAY